MKRIVLTGGPCGGKTTAMNFVPEKLSDYGCSVVCVPELATLTINAGISPVTLLKDTRKKYLQFEELLLKGQISQERYYANQLRTKGGRKQVLLMDRGCMDVKVYLKDEEFDMLLRRNHLSLVNIRDKRYDGVYHLSSVTDGRPELYNKENNPARMETPEQALQTDARTKEVWIGHPHFRVIDNSTLFKEKMKRLLKEIQRGLGIPIMLEIERKFLLLDPFSIQRIPVPYQRISIEQAYLEKTDQRIRSRGQDGSSIYYLTRKTPSSSGTFTKEEKESRISGSWFYQLLQRQDPKRTMIKKERVCFIWKNQYFELDLFLKPEWCRGMFLLEIELTEENDKVEIPDWLGRVKEVTEDPNYKNSSIAKRP